MKATTLRTYALLAFLVVMIAGFFVLKNKDFDRNLAAVWDTGAFTLNVYGNMNLTGSPTYIATTQSINSGSIPPSATDLSARWTGTITAPKASTYQFMVESEDGVRIFVDNKQILSRWSDQNRWEAFTTSLSAGQHTLKVEYYQQGAKGRV
ncbi:MAG: galactose oxidase, partial [Candidatus Paceibacter sp.]|nr:galactose oxidase [Candidatus Paceibacter sp.]